MKRNILVLFFIMYGNNFCAAQKDDERSLCQSPRFQEAFDRAEEHFGEDGAL